VPRFLLYSSLIATLLVLTLRTHAADNANRLDVDPPTINFGNVGVGSTAKQWGTITGADKPVTISSAISSSTEFSLSGLSFPLTIPAGGSRGFMVAFSPHAAGGASATLSFKDVAGKSLLAGEYLTGVGIISKGHSVDLSWNDRSHQNVVGYNVYRANKRRGPYRKINPVLIASTLYTDTSVADGKTYYYVTTAVDSDNEESAYSNQTQATIP
jgi:hypothetical protein